MSACQSHVREEMVLAPATLWGETWAQEQYPNNWDTKKLPVKIIRTVKATARKVEHYVVQYENEEPFEISARIVDKWEVHEPTTGTIASFCKHLQCF